MRFALDVDRLAGDALLRLRACGVLSIEIPLNLLSSFRLIVSDIGLVFQSSPTVLGYSFDWDELVIPLDAVLAVGVQSTLT